MCSNPAIFRRAQVLQAAPELENLGFLKEGFRLLGFFWYLRFLV